MKDTLTTCPECKGKGEFNEAALVKFDTNGHMIFDEEIRKYPCPKCSGSGCVAVDQGDQSTGPRPSHPSSDDSAPF